MRCLIIDNYDSFTWNLADYVATIYGSEPLVLRNDQYSWHEIMEMGCFSSIIVSPGPGSVTNLDDFNVSKEALLQDDIPVLGVCLGFQGLAHIYGGAIQCAPVPFHGRKSVIHHDGSDLFQGIPSSFDAVRYHSLIVASESLPECLRVTARSECGLIMGLRHVSLPKWGVQFHPESILTRHGRRIISNFRDEAYRHAKLDAQATTKACAPSSCPMDERNATKIIPLHVHARQFSRPVSAELAFMKLFAARKHAFWLDSQTVCEGASRFSFMGSAEDESVLRFSVSGQRSSVRGQQYFADLERELESAVVQSGIELPFEFRGGYVGYMTYEMKSVFGAKTSHGNRIPDGVWMRADRFLAFDQVAQKLWLVAVAAEGEDEAANAWMDTMALQLEGLLAAERQPETLNLRRIHVRMNFARDAYLAAIERCKEKIIDGESYEVCLTNEFSLDVKINPLDLYLVMRRENAAPFGAFIRSGDSYVLSTSPERFLRVDARGNVQTKPIKGTCARADDPAVDRENADRLAGSEKDQAENLMIVDLMRNDLGRVSTPGSIMAPKLMDIESYKTVHQMVSTVESQLKPDCTLVDLLRAVYPGESITGAPKIRTMEIIDQLEPSARGVYCGTIGYLGFNRIADLNIAIRSLSYDGHTIRFGAGGAVTYLSDPGEEFQETLLKAEAVLRPVWRYLSRLDSPLEYRLLDASLRLEQTVIASARAR